MSHCIAFVCWHFVRRYIMEKRLIGFGLIHKEEIVSSIPAVEKTRLALLRFLNVVVRSRKTLFLLARYCNLLRLLPPPKASKSVGVTVCQYIKLVKSRYFFFNWLFLLSHIRNVVGYHATCIMHHEWMSVVSLLDCNVCSWAMSWGAVCVCVCVCVLPNNQSSPIKASRRYFMSFSFRPTDCAQHTSISHFSLLSFSILSGGERRYCIVQYNDDNYCNWSTSREILASSIAMLRLESYYCTVRVRVVILASSSSSSSQQACKAKRRCILHTCNS